LNSVVIKSIDRAKIHQAVVSYASQVRRKHPEVERVIWFGSWITGRPTPGSDVDLCLIISSSNQAPRDRISGYLPLGFPVGIDLFVYTVDEFERLQRSAPDWHQAIVSGVEI
jgi:predicted nucleotidyltransferase